MQKAAERPDHTQVCLWLDFYGQLLTDKSREVLELYFQEDMSLSEIAEVLAISRQGVHDKIRQGVRNLNDYEQKLGLADRFLLQRELAAKALDVIDAGDYTKARELICRLTEAL